MKQDEFLNKMENMKVPDTGPLKHSGPFRLTLLHVKRSASIGIWFILVPCYFLFCVVMKYYFHVNLRILDVVEEMMASMDHNDGLGLLSPLLLVGLPLAGIVINALAITYFYWDKSQRELTINIRIKWLNILIILISLMIVGIFLLYSITENFKHKI